jgi:hypothetical protein
MDENKQGWSEKVKPTDLESELLSKLLKFVSDANICIETANSGTIKNDIPEDNLEGFQKLINTLEDLVKTEGVSSPKQLEGVTEEISTYMRNADKGCVASSVRSKIMKPLAYGKDDDATKKAVEKGFIGFTSLENAADKCEDAVSDFIKKKQEGIKM